MIVRLLQVAMMILQTFGHFEIFSRFDGLFSVLSSFYMLISFFSELV